MSSWTVIDAPEAEMRSGELGRRLRRFNSGIVGEYPESQPVWLSARDTEDRMIGGLRGYVFLYWLHIDVLWVDESFRSTGLGSELLRQGEARGKAMGAHGAKLDTFEWQAPKFYERRGYREFGRIDDHTDGFYLAFMMKNL